MGGFGAFGKLPTLGDFFRIGPLPGFIDPWDRWVQAGLVAAQQALGPRWTPCYMSAPIWRFTLSAGLAGPDAVLGVLMPSVDRVGRKFPLTLATQIPAAPMPVALHLLSGSIFAALEAIALDALDETATRETLTAALAGVAPSSATPISSIRQSSGSLAVLAGPAPAERLAAHLADQTFAVPSVWSTDPETDGRLMIVDGLPGPSLMQALLDPGAADWQAAPARGASA